MKSFIKKPMLLMLLLVAAINLKANATDSLFFDAMSIQPFKYIMQYNSSEVENANFKIFDEENHLLVTNTFSGEVKKIYNFEYLPAGNYTIIIENESAKIIQPFTMGRSGVNFQQKAEKITYPKIKELDDKKIGVDLSDFDFKFPMEIIFEDLDQEYRTSYNLNAKKSYVFNVDNLVKGHYEVKLLAGDKVISRTITL